MDEQIKNPFPGLRPFEFGDNHLFFGRDEQTTELTSRLRKNRFVAVVGTSGSGKSSLVRAGLLPELLSGTMAGAGSSWETAIMRPGGDPLTNLANAIVEADLYDPEEEDINSQVRATLTRSGLGLVEAMRQSDLPEGSNFLLVVDQFEEIFRFRRSDDATDEQAAFFVNLLLEASAQADLPLYIIITMRSDFLGECSQFPRLADTVNEGEFLIPRLNRDQRKEAIVGPVKVAGGGITDRLLLRLLNDIGDDPDQLPILQHALMRTWDLYEAQGGDGELDLGHYNSTGGMSEALSRHADEVLNEQADEEHRRIAEKLFKSLTEKVDANRGIRRPMALRELHEICGGEEAHLREVIDSFRRTGCTFLMPAGERKITLKTIIDISHESLMRAWRNLRNWVDEEAQSAKIYRRLADTATLYKEDKAGLYRDPDLQIAISWREANRPNKTWADRYYSGFDGAMAFLDTSHDEAVREEREREEARQREVAQVKALAKARARSVTIFKFACVGVTILAITAVFAMIDARESRDEADRQIINLAKRSIATGEAMDAEDDHLGALVWYADAIGLAAKDLSIQSKYQAVFKTKLDNAIKLRYSHNIGEPISYARLLPGGTKSLVVTKNGNNMQQKENHVYIVDLTSGDKRMVCSVNGLIEGATMNKQRTAFAFLENKVRTYHVVNLETAKETYKRQSAFSNIKPPVFTADGNHLIVGGSMENRGANISVVNLTDNKEVASKDFTGWLANFHSVGGADIGFLVNEFSGVDKFISVIWSWNSGKENILFNGEGNEGVIARSLVDERKENIIAHTIDFPNNNFSQPSPKQVSYVQVLEKEGKEVVYSTSKKKQRIRLYALSPNSKHLALARDDGGVEMHDMDRLAMIWESEPEQIIGGGVKSLDFSPDGTMVLVTGGSNNVGLWESATGRLISSNLKHYDILAMGSWNETGNAFVTATRKGEIRLYQISNPQGANYLTEVPMSPETAKAIAAVLSNRAIQEGRIVSFDGSSTNAPPELTSLPPIHQFGGEALKRKWHLARAQAVSSENKWSAVKFHLDNAAAISPLGWLELQSLSKANLNLGYYNLAEGERANLNKGIGRIPAQEKKYMPDIVNGWKENKWHYSGHYEITNFDLGMVQEQMNQMTLQLELEKTWNEIKAFKPSGVSANNINPGELYVDAPPNCLYYVAKTFTVKDEGYYDVIFDSDDGMKAWVNGNLVNVYGAVRGMFFAGEDRVQVWLRQGLNIVVIKVVNANGDTGFSFELQGLKRKQDINKYYARVAAIKPSGYVLSNMDEDLALGELMGIIQEVALFRPEKSVINELYQKVKNNSDFKGILEGTFLRPASYVAPSERLTPEQLKDGFTLECFIKTQSKSGIQHIVCNGGSWEESGFSLLSVRGNLRGELQNTETQEKILMDVPFPYDLKWHHVAMVYDSKNKQAIVYLDGKPATVPTTFKSPLTFNPKYLRIGENAMRRMGFNGGITDVKIWNKVLSQENIQKHARGAISLSSESLLVNLPLRFSSGEDVIKQLENDRDLIVENIKWEKSSVKHSMAKEDSGVYAEFINQGFGYSMPFTAAGVLEYRRGNYENALELLFRAFNNGRYLPEIKLRTGRGDITAKIFLAMAFQKNGRKDDYERFRQAVNDDLNKFEMRTWELPGERSVQERIRLKAFQREMNALSGE